MTSSIDAPRSCALGVALALLFASLTSSAQTPVATPSSAPGAPTPVTGRRSWALIGVGIGVSTVGVGIVAGGIGAWSMHACSSHEPCHDGGALGVPMVIGGGLGLASGILMIVLGARPSASASTASLVPRLASHGSRLDLAWRF